MQYRVNFGIYGGVYFTEWFDTEDEAQHFVQNASSAPGVFPRWIENSDGDVI